MSVDMAAMHIPDIYGYSKFAYNGQSGLDGGSQKPANAVFIETWYDVFYGFNGLL